MKNLVALVAAVAVLLPTASSADDELEFKGGIGVVPVSSVNASGIGAPNVVLGVQPGGQPWVIARLEAEVKGGRITVEGRGLLLAGGNGIGTPGGQSVEARLFCGGVAHDTGLVALAPDGDFRIDDALTPAPPATCDAPVLLIVNAAGRWFAAGIVRR